MALSCDRRKFLRGGCDVQATFVHFKCTVLQNQVGTPPITCLRQGTEVPRVWCQPDSLVRKTLVWLKLVRSRL